MMPMNNGQGNCGTYTCGDDETSFCGDCGMPPTMPTVAPPMPTVAPPMPTMMPTMPPTMPTVAPPTPTMMPMNNGQGNCGTYTCGDDETSFCGDCGMPPTMPTVAPPMPTVA